METASFAGIIKTIFYILLFYYIFKFAMRLLLPMVLKKAVEKAEENLRNRDARQYPNQNTNTYKSTNDVNPREARKVGEYVDYEEIE